MGNVYRLTLIQIKFKIILLAFVVNNMLTYFFAKYTIPCLFYVVSAYQQYTEKSALRSTKIANDS